MRQHIEAKDGRKCWGSKRERDRMKARFLVRERVQKEAEDNNYSSTSPAAAITLLDLSNVPDAKLVVDELLTNIIGGHRSKFSLTYLQQRHELLSACIQTEMIEPETLKHALQVCHAWFGLEYSEFLKDYISHLQSITILEFAVWLGKFSILGSFVVSGVRGCASYGSKSELEMREALQQLGSRVLKRFMDGFPLPLATYILKRAVDFRREAFRHRRRQGTASTDNRSCSMCENPIPLNLEMREALQQLGSRVLKRFMDGFPLPLATYILKRVVDFRREAFRQRLCQGTDSTDNRSCSMCETPIPLNLELCIDMCHHMICEACFWKDILKNVDHRGELADVVICPICGLGSSEAETIVTAPKNVDGKRKLDNCKKRCQESLQKFLSLPKDRKALMQTTKRRSKRPESDHIAPCWNDAVKNSLGLTQDVRKDKFFLNVDRQAIHFVGGCLEAGVDVNWTNDYGQTALYLACWKGTVPLVTMLLEYGADPNINANDGSSAYTIAETCGHADIVDCFNAMEDVSFDSASSLHPLANLLDDGVLLPSKSMEMTTLISRNLDHPGAGSYTIDNVLSDDAIETILGLWRRLPIDLSHTKKAAGTCSIRSYYCDAEKYIQNLLESMIRKAGLSTATSPAVIFPHMRFLHYADAGVELAPHVDLFHTDSNGRQSTHSFLLYLADCKEGGETRLLRSLAGEGRFDALAKVSPRRGRLLLFPHLCPHEGSEVISAPKILLRGEVRLV